MTKHVYPLSIRQCRLISAVAQYAGESGASKALNTSKSNISRGLKKAEETLDCRLFYRDRVGFLPTREGSIVISFARNLIREIENVEKRLSDEGERKLLLSPFIDWRHLEAVYTTVNSGRVSTAAKELGITQSAVSRTLTELEHFARQKLFIRRSHSLEPLDAARELSSLHRKLETEIAGLYHALAVTPGALTGRLFIGILPFSSDEIIPRAIGILSQRHPHVHLQPIQAPFQMLMTSLRSGEIDCIFGVMREPDTFADLLEIPLTQSRFSLVARLDHPVHNKKDIRIADLVDEQWLVAPHGAPSRIYLDNLFEQQGLKPPERIIETIAFNVNEQMLIYSDAIGLLVHHPDKSWPLDLRLKAIDIELPNPECVLGLILPRGELPNTVVRFRQILEEIAEDP